MKILIVSGYDSMNYTLAACAAEAIRRGHEVLVIVRDAADSGNCGMYERRNIRVVSAAGFDDRSLDSVDLVITSPVKPYDYAELFDEIHARGLFTIAFAALFSSIVMREYPDLVFCLGDAKMEEFERYALRYNCISVGNPQYDPLIDHRRGRDENPDSIRRVLIVDQGGYPYGSKGKNQLAKTLCAIAEQDPERIYEIKQRYNGRKVLSAAHAISERLADFITDLPENLRFLETDKELEELLPAYDAMITTWSTAFIGAVVMNIPLVLIAGLDSEDRFDVRRQRIGEAYEDLRGTGCVRDYRSLQKERISFSYVDEAYRRHLLYDADSKSAPRVLDVIELLFEKVIRRGLRINERFQMDGEAFINRLDSFAVVRADDPGYIRRRNFLTCFNDRMQEWVYINRCMGGVMDLGTLTDYYGTEPADDPDDTLKRAEGEYQRLRDDFFGSEEGTTLSGSDRILQDFYFDWLYDRGMLEKLKDPGLSIRAPESRYYNLCLYELDHRNRKEGQRYLDAFLNAIYEGKSTDLLKYQRFAQSMLRAAKKLGLIRFAGFVIRGRHLKMIEHCNRAFVTDHAPATVLLMYFFWKEKRFDACMEVYGAYSEKKKRRERKSRTGVRKIADAGAGFLADGMYKRSRKAAECM